MSLKELVFIDKIYIILINKSIIFDQNLKILIFLESESYLAQNKYLKHIFLKL